MLMNWNWMSLNNGERGYYLNGDHGSWRVWQNAINHNEWFVQLPRNYLTEEQRRSIYSDAVGPCHDDIINAKLDLVGLAHVYPSADAAIQAVEILIREEAEAERERLDALAVLDALAKSRGQARTSARQSRRVSTADSA